MGLILCLSSGGDAIMTNKKLYMGFSRTSLNSFQIVFDQGSNMCPRQVRRRIGLTSHYRTAGMFPSRVCSKKSLMYRMCSAMAA